MERSDRLHVSKLRVGVVQPGPFFVPPSPAIARATDEAAALLRTLSCAVVPFGSPTSSRSTASSERHRLRRRRHLQAALAGGAQDPVVGTLLRNFRLGRGLRAVASLMMKRNGDPRVAEVLDRLGRRPVQEFWSLTNQIRAARQLFLDAMAQAQLDLLLCAPFATPAAPHTSTREFMPAGAYSWIFNVSSSPLGSCPSPPCARAKRRGRRAAGLGKMAAAIDQGSAGLPVGVQLVGRPFEENTVLAAMIQLEERAPARFPARRRAPPARDGAARTRRAVERSSRVFALHPVVIHFAIALLVVGPAMDTLGLLLRRESLCWPAAGTRCLGPRCWRSPSSSGLAANAGLGAAQRRRTGAAQPARGARTLCVALWIPVALWRGLAGPLIPVRARTCT